MKDQAAILAAVSEALSRDEKEHARTLLAEHYPFSPIEKTKRSYSERQMTEVFARDGFIDRYKGTRLETIANVA